MPARWMTQEAIDAHQRKHGRQGKVVAAAPAVVVKVEPRQRMNKLEASYAQYLELMRHAGSVQWYAFEAIKLRLADNTYYTPDFAVIGGMGGRLFFHEVKGFWREDARVKIKVAAEMFPHFGFLAVTREKGGAWKTENFK